MSLEDDLSCIVCTEVFREPVLLVCGHSFCRQCIIGHWNTSRSRNCPVCRHQSPHEPLLNLSLRNTCETYLKESRGNEKRKNEEKMTCDEHGEKFLLFCQTDEVPICKECKKHEHKYHKTQTLQQIVRMRKGKLKAALRPAEKKLSSLQNGTALDNEISKYIKSQSHQTEQRLKEEFKKLYQFLKKEEESRISALNKEEKETSGKMEQRINSRIESLSEMIRDVEEEIKDHDDIIFIQNYDSIMKRIENTTLDPCLCSETLIDVSKYLGNLKYNVWEKMKDICPNYPMTLNPNTAAPCCSVSDDLTSVTSTTSCVHKLDGIGNCGMVLGNVGYGVGVHSFTVDVGNSRHWKLGVFHDPLVVVNGVYGLRRDGDFYNLMFTQQTFKLNTDPKVVKVKIENKNDMWGRSWRTVSFIDVKNDCYFAKFTRVPSEGNLFPFVIPGDHSRPLRIMPVDVTLISEETEKKLSFLQRHKFILFICFCFLLILMLIVGRK